MKTLSWKSFKGIDYVLSIDDGANTTTALTPGASPFVTQVSDSDDFYSPVREQTGNIGIVGEVNVMEELLASTPDERPVTLSATQSGTTSTVWKGYLQTSAFSQPWDKGPNDISIPVVSHLGIIESYDFEETGYLNFADFIGRMNACTGTACFSSFVFPLLIEPDVTLAYKFSGLNFADWEDDTQSYEYSDYKKVLEEYCKVFGLVAMEAGDVLYFIAPDDYSGYYRFTAAQLSTIASGGTAEYTYIAPESVIGVIYGADHEISYQPGKKSIKITGNSNPMDKTLYSLSLENMTQVNTDYGQKSGNYGEDKPELMVYYTKNYSGDGIVTVLNPGTNVRFNSWESGDDATGSSLVSERWYLINSAIRRDSYWVDDTGWMNHVVFKGDSSMAQTPVVTIHTGKYLERTRLYGDCYLLINFNVKRLAATGATYENFSGNLYVTVSVGSDTLYSDICVIKDGTTKSYGVAGVMMDATEGLIINQTNGYFGSGEVVVTIAQPVAGDFWESLDYLYWYSISNIKVSLSNSWTRHLEDVEDVNIEERIIESGFVDELSQENAFTTYRTDQMGYGIILDSSLNLISTLYDNKTPEDALADRMATHYNESKKKLRVQLEGVGHLFPPSSRVLPGSGTVMTCLSQSMNWRDDLNEVTLYEP